jgi:DNA repair protein RecO (recombination protein O)
MSLYRDEAVVLRTHKLGEADRIVTLLTREHGQVRAVAKGVRRTKSKFGARLEPAMHVDLQLHSGRNLDVVTQAETIHSYGDALSADYSKWTIVNAILETAQRFTALVEEPALQQFLLVVGALRTLAESDLEPALVLDSYLIRSLSVGGYAPSFSDCSRCGEPGPHRWFSLSGGGSVCAECRPPASATPAEQTLSLLSALLSGDWQIATQSESKHRKEAHGLVAAYLSWHLEHGLRSLPLVERA